MGDIEGGDKEEGWAEGTDEQSRAVEKGREKTRIE
jgi:hypothetical protein